jgi:hypothetical protein
MDHLPPAVNNESHFFACAEDLCMLHTFDLTHVLQS